MIRFFAFCLACLACQFASAYEIKGLVPKISIENLKLKLPGLICKKWMDGPYEQTCDAPGGPNLKTVGDQNLLSLRVFADKQGITHELIFHLACGVSTEALARSLSTKFGKASTANLVNGRHEWNQADGQMILQEANGKEGVCHLLSISDSDVLKWRNKPPAARVSNDF